MVADSVRGMEEKLWTPHVKRTDGLLPPVRLDPSGRAGPTRVQVRGKAWRRVVRGWYVPAEAPDDVEQRILEQSVRVAHPAGITGWASLRWRGAAYFDGTGRTPDDLLPVPLVLGGWHDLGQGHGAAISRERLSPYLEVEEVDGVRCAIAERAVFDEVRRVRGLRRRVTAVDMALAAGVTDLEAVLTYVAGCNGWTGVPGVRAALALASPDSRSPQETLMRLVWELDAGLPRPLCNQPVFDLAGNLLGIPDLFDPVRGVVGEYDGRHHAQDDRRRSDLTREHRFRDHGLEYFALVRGEVARPEPAAARMRAVCRRAEAAPGRPRDWTLEQPAWWRTWHPVG